MGGRGRGGRMGGMQDTQWQSGRGGGGWANRADKTQVIFDGKVVRKKQVRARRSLYRPFILARLLVARDPPSIATTTHARTHTPACRVHTWLATVISLRPFLTD